MHILISLSRHASNVICAELAAADVDTLSREKGILALRDGLVFVRRQTAMPQAAALRRVPHAVPPALRLAAIRAARFDLRLLARCSARHLVP